MPSINVVDMKGSNAKTIELNDSIFAIEPNEAVMHQMVVLYLANQRQGTQSALTRSEVSGGGRKPWRQKGTGRARQGSTRSPQWTHVEMLKAIGSEKKTLIVLPEVDSKVIKSANNIPGVKTCQYNEINVYDILNADKLVIAEGAIAKIEEVYA